MYGNTHVSCSFKKNYAIFFEKTHAVSISLIDTKDTQECAIIWNLFILCSDFYQEVNRLKEIFGFRAVKTNVVIVLLKNLLSIFGVADTGVQELT